MTDPALSMSPYVPTATPASARYRWGIAMLPAYIALAALPLFVLTQTPIAGWLVAVGFWGLNSLVQRGIVASITGLPQVLAVGTAGISMMLRVWVITGILFFIGAELQIGDTTIGAGREDVAVPAMLLFMLLMTFDIGVRASRELRRYKTGAPTADDPAATEEA